MHGTCKRRELVTTVNIMKTQRAVILRHSGKKLNGSTLQMHLKIMYLSCHSFVVHFGVVLHVRMWGEWITEKKEWGRGQKKEDGSLDFSVLVPGGVTMGTQQCTSDGNSTWVMSSLKSRRQNTNKSHTAPTPKSKGGVVNSHMVPHPLSCNSLHCIRPCPPEDVKNGE